MRRSVLRFAAPAMLAALSIGIALGMVLNGPDTVAQAAAAPEMAAPKSIIAGMRRLTESQYRNTIADLFGPDIVVAGRFEPIVRSPHQLIASGASIASISPAGFEQFDIMARSIASQVFDGRHRSTFVTCAPKDEKAADRACADTVLADLGRYVLRRSLTGEERMMYGDMADTAAEKSGSFDHGLELALASMLSSPEFLNIIERAEPDPQHPGSLRLDNYSRAARLSFLLWNTTPNKMLLNAAGAGKLTDPAQMHAIAAGMIQSPRLEQGMRAFFADMLMFEKFDVTSKDPLIFPRFNPEVAKALPEQMQRMIIDQLLTRHGDYRDLFTTPNSFMTKALGPLYNVRVRAESGWEPYAFPQDSDRVGLIGQAGFLAMYSHPGRTSPTIRGKAIRELLLCQPVPDPPGNVNFSVVQDTNNPLMKTARLRLAAHADEPSCSGCHRITDPIGLTLEGFDGIGSRRNSENGVPIDLSGSLNKVAFTGEAGLGKALAASPQVTECASARMLEYTLGRASDDDSQMVEALARSFAAGGYRFPELMLAAATMPDAYRVTSNPLAPKTNVSLAPTSNRKVASR